MSDALIKLYDPQLISDSLLTSAFIISLSQNKLVLGYNNWRKQLEIPARQRNFIGS